MERDNRYNAKHNRAEKHFKNKVPRTKKDYNKPRIRPAEDRGGGRNINKLTAQETLDILENGGYTSNDIRGYTYESKNMDISVQLKYAIDNTIDIDPDKQFNALDKTVDNDTDIEICMETTLSGCKRMVDEGFKTIALNFASAKNPGGDFLKGSNAQEESLARACGLYYCIKDSSMYEINKSDNNKCMYSHHMIYSPNVPVFRDDDDELLSEIYNVSFISAPAVNAGQAIRRIKDRRDIDVTMYDRMDRILAVASHYGYEAIILGAYGCGVFGNDLNIVGNMWMKLLDNKYRNIFKRVVFSVIGDEEYDILIKTFDL